MATDRKDHRKHQRLKGIAARKQANKVLAHQKDLQTLQRVLDHTQELQRKRPELFAAVMDSVKALADANGVPIETIMKDGVMIVGDDGHKVRKSPQDILDDIAGLHPTFRVASDVTRNAKAILDARGNPLRMPADTIDPMAELTELPSLERQREASRNVRSGLKSLDLETCSETALQEAMAMGYEPATNEWLNRHPDAEASDGGRLG